MAKAQTLDFIANCIQAKKNYIGAYTYEKTEYMEIFHMYN
jgi:6-phosphogluconate dehydrogenase